MIKRILASVLCLVMMLGSLVCLSGCSTDPDDKGQILTMYLSDQVYDLDPANAYYNDATTSVVNLLFDTLFKIDDNGKVKKSLVKKYVINEDASANEYTMDIYLNDSYWSDGVYVSANDVVYAWKRVLDVESSYEAASLLYDIKNARSVKEGDMSIDDLAIYAEGELMISVEFEGPINYDQFILNLTSVALAPLREDIAAKPDWAKKPATIVCSGPLKLGRVGFKEDPTPEDEENPENGPVKYYDANHKETNSTTGEVTLGAYRNEALVNFLILERNAYYYRNPEKEEKLDKNVTPYRIIVDFSMTDEQVAAAYEAGAILYVDNIPYSWRNDSAYEDLLKDVKVTDARSNHTYYFNQNALIDDGAEGEYLFANKTVRQVLSKAIDRQAIADAILYAEAATGIVPNGVFDTNSKKTTFRDAATSSYKNLTTVSASELKSELSAAGIEAEKYSFSITVAAYDEVHVAIAEMVAEQWSDLGFNVSVEKRGTIINNDYYKWTDNVPSDICDDLYAEDLRAGDFEVIALDMGAITMDAYATLAPFAKAFSGQGMDMSDPENYQLTPHITGFDNEEYNNIMEAVYFLQYYNDFNKFFNNSAYGTDYFVAKNETADQAKAEADAVYATITDVYEKYGITPSEKTYLADRAKLLHAAEDLLMEEVPVTPIVANQYASLTSSTIKNVSKTYTNPVVLNKINVPATSYGSFHESVAAFLEAHYEEYIADETSYFYDFREFEFEEFKGETSHYGFLFEEDE